ncbi:MAG TPA: hypothetical protein VF715_00110 [Thermoleophilaceae bacterium]|jgi:Flp pilus assembly protein TadB
MAQTKRKRNRKHRGTQAGTIETRGRTGRAPTKADAKTIRQARRDERLNKPPSWRSSFNRAAVIAIIFGVMTVVLFQRSVAQAAVLAVIVFPMYVPLSYYTDRLIYRRHQRRGAAAGR